MTPKKSNFNNFLTYRLFSHWYLTLISAVVFFLVGPFAIWWEFINDYNHNNPDIKLNSFFESSNLTFFYLLSFVMATIIGLVMFSFLNDKKQVNFFHSQPISRKKIFLNNYIASFLLGAVPLILMFLISLIVDTYFHDSKNVFYHFSTNLLKLLVFYCSGLSIPVFAVQLAGSNIFSFYITGFFNLFLPFTILIVVNLLSTFSMSLNYSQNFIYYFSIITHFLFCTTASRASIYPSLVYLLITVILGLISYMLYKVRPSEVAGRNFIYKSIRVFIKYISIFVFAGTITIMLNTASYDDSQKNVVTFLIFASIFAFFIEAFFQKSFKKLGSLLISTLISTIFFVCVVFGINLSANYLETRVPSAKDVKTVNFQFDYFIDQTYFSSNTIKSFDYSFDDPKLIEKTLKTIDKIVTTSNYEKNNNDNNHAPYSITVTYNGSPLSRKYTISNIKVIEHELAGIFEDPAYKSFLILPFKKIADKNYPNDSIWMSYTNGKNTFNSHNKNYATRKALVDAFIKDIKNIKYEDITIPEYNHGFSDETSKYNSFSIYLYPDEELPNTDQFCCRIYNRSNSFVNTMQVLEKFEQSS